MSALMLQHQFLTVKSPVGVKTADKIVNWGLAALIVKIYFFHIFFTLEMLQKKAKGKIP